MNRSSLRQMARELGLSAATVSRALHHDARVHPETARRIMALAQRCGYHLDPVVSEGLSRARRRSFYRETVAWCGDRPRDRMHWLKPLFQSAEDYGGYLGYKLEYFHFDRPEPRVLGRLTRIWKARGIRGILLAPFSRTYADLPFSWERFAWIAVGHSLPHPVLHRVGRDYEVDIRRALEWLGRKGCRRPCFVQDPELDHLFRRPMLRAALSHYHDIRPRPAQPYIELDSSHPEHFVRWLERNRPDGVILPGQLEGRLCRFGQLLAGLPIAYLSPEEPPGPDHLSFTANYETMGRAAVNFMHQLLANREFGIPLHEQTVLLASCWQEAAVENRSPTPHLDRSS